MAEKNKKVSNTATPQKQLALTTSTMAIPPIELVNRYQVLNPKNQYGSSSSLAYPPITQNYTPVNQIIGTSSQHIIPAKTIYIAKTQLQNLFYIEPSFQHIKNPNDLALHYFPENWHFIPHNPDKSISFYKKILEHTHSVVFKQTHDAKDSTIINYQSFYIHKIINISEWGHPSNLQPLPDNELFFNYYDYINAWSYALLFENSKFSHSWFFQFDQNFNSPFPTWFLRWWSQMGASNDIIPKNLLDQVDYYYSKQKLNLHQNQFPRLLLFIAKYKVAWIFRWKYVISDNLVCRQFLIKWWNKFNIQQVIDQVQNDFKIKVPKPVQIHDRPPSPYMISNIKLDSPTTSSPPPKSPNQTIIKFAQQLIMQAAQNPNQDASKALLQIATDMLSQSQDTEASTSSTPEQNPFDSLFQDSQDPNEL